MKMSTIVRVMAQIVFWFTGIMFYSWIFTLDDPVWALALMTVITVVLAGFCRMIKNKPLTFLAHILLAIVPVMFVMLEVLSNASMFFGIGIIVLSLIARLSGAKFMDRGHNFGRVVLIVLYLIGSVMGYKYMWLNFAGVFVYTFLVFMQNNFEKNEEFVENECYSSTVDIDKTKGVSNLLTLVISLVMAVVCLLFSLLGKIPVLADLSSLMRLKLNNVFSFLKRVSFNNNVRENITEEPSMFVEENAGEVSDTSERPFLDKVFGIIAIIIIVGLFVYAIYSGIKRLYGYYMRRHKMESVEEVEVSLKKDSPVKKKKINPRELDKSYSNRKALRRIYKKRIKGKSGKREDLVNKTPYEQRKKSLDEGNNISTEFVDMYERARYSTEEVTREDVRKMNKM